LSVPAAAESSESAVRWDDAVLMLTAAVLGGAAFWLVRGALIDDAYITLSYARNMAVDLHWGLIPTEPANSATSPLNVLLLAAATALLRLAGGGDPIWGLGIIVVGSAMAMAWWWTRIAAILRLPLGVPILGVALVLVNPFVLSAIGLEVVLIPTLLTGLLAAALSGRPVAFGALAGLAVLARLDLIVFVIPLSLSNHCLRRELPRAAVVALAVTLPWFTFSWWYFGSAIPDTFVIKTLQQSFGDWTFANGAGLYYERDALATVTSFAPVPLGLLALAILAALRGARRPSLPSELMPIFALGGGGVAYFLAYTLLGVPPYQWYYVPTVTALTIAACAAIGAAFSHGRLPRELVAIPGTTVLVAILAGAVVADLRGGSPWTVPVIFGNWAIPADYARVGRELGERVGEETVIAPPEIGTLAYYCECSIVDAFADRGRVLPMIEERIERAGWAGGKVLELNYRQLERNLTPRPAQYRLVWEAGPAKGPGEWETWSPTAGVAHLRLEPILAE
jgi:hypothetical protein